ncbi:TIGR01906 family membrane protein [Companilactobacillus allii]|uniref:Rhodopsin n=1 Tax=Companilactobacillus allii TaxID=1847728 RepID=A0A1P8PZQ7_9LACO|nr:TIGR01906 family membrane protein [Companilactobacillus allii]APX71031.1 rhodopsin [Companilactobacillus allii]USQ68109.1 TIGR01906 family membrane protein [Companilactobacillus allii]
MSNFQKDTFYTVILALFILTLSITVTIFASYGLFFFAIKHYYLEQAVNMSFGAIMHNYNQMMNYLINPFNGTFKLDDFQSSLAGRIHFEDCKKLFMLNFGVLIGSGIYLWFQRQKRIYFKPVFKYIAIGGVILAILMAVDFDGFFVVFHEVLFRNSDWLFDPDKDPVINILPEEFFTQCFVLFFVLFEGLNIWKYIKKART